MSIPSLRSLQIFEAAARHENLRAAADSLFLTHGAVSRQVRSLESELGVELFRRAGRRVKLTSHGRRLQLALTDALQVITNVTADIRSEVKAESEKLVITVLPAFAKLWLKPRLQKFLDANPGIIIDIVATIAPLDLLESGIDLGIRNGAGKWAGLTSKKLANETLHPVASAGGIVGFARLPLSPQEILEYPLLNPFDDWASWFRRAGILSGKRTKGKTYEDVLHLLEAVEKGEGVALGRSWLVADALANGTLIRLNGPAIPSRRDYYIVYPVDSIISESANVFIKWLLEQMGSK